MHLYQRNLEREIDISILKNVNEILKVAALTRFIYCLSIDLIFLWMQKDLDFTLKVVGGDMSMVPGLSDSIDVRKCFLYLLLRNTIVVT